MGMFFAPGLPLLNTFKLLVLLYVRSWAVVTSNVPPETVFKASDNNNFYLLFLLTMLFLCTLPVGYAVVWLEPSWHCGPFSDYPKIYQLATSTLIGGLPPSLYPIIDYISSPGVVIPAGLLLVLVIYYLVSLTAALREANSDLRDQLRQERSAEKRKALDARSGKGRSETPTSRWGRVVPLTPLPRPRLDATSSDPEKTAAHVKKPHAALSPEAENGPIIALCDPPKPKDEGPWPDDVTDLGHSEVFDDSLSESRQVGREKMRGEGTSERHERVKEYPEKEREQEIHHRGKSRKNSFSMPAKEEGEFILSRVPKGRQKSYGSQTRGHRLPQERKQSDESLHRDSPTKPKPRPYVDSPRERRRSSSSYASKVKHKFMDESAPEPNTTQEVNKTARTHRGLAKRDSDKLPPEPETPTKGAPSVRHRREPSILKMDDLRRGSNGQKAGGKGATSGHHRSSSDDSQGMQTIPIIKISKEDSVERSLQQAKLQRQDKTQEETDATAATKHPSQSPDATSHSPKHPSNSPDAPSRTTKHPSQSPDATSHSPKHPSNSPDAPSRTTKHPSQSPDTTSHSSNTASPQSRDRSGSNNIDLKTVPGKEVSVKPKKSKPAPIETNLDDPYLPESDTVALIAKVKDEIVPLQLAVEEETVILSSDEESTLLEK
ncbi:transmembrane channel-like protein [Eriocheir sinensis]|uniref:transmembrane channel-like protein n=1 Tax=Eriocheir sinensis TaxID=95602 RepID=UPI0021C6109D|nr:transmembrane channel-like protein [Eriocheir sinensis]XP_050707778.1 transmembrane channel-like protein [Eriocheir sinensis]